MEFIANAFVHFGAIVALIALGALIVVLIIGTWDSFIVPMFHQETQSYMDDPYFNKIEEFRNDFS